MHSRKKRNRVTFFSILSFIMFLSLFAGNTVLADTVADNEVTYRFDASIDESFVGDSEGLTSWKKTDIGGHEIIGSNSTVTVGDWGEINFTVPKSGDWEVIFTGYTHSRGGYADLSMDGVVLAEDVLFDNMGQERATFEVPLGIQSFEAGETYSLRLTSTELLGPYGGFYADSLRLEYSPEIPVLDEVTLDANLSIETSAPNTVSGNQFIKEGATTPLQLTALLTDNSEINYYSSETTDVLGPLDDLVNQLVESGDLVGPLVPQVKNRIMQAEKHLSKGREEQAIKHLNDLLKSVERKSKDITEEVQQTLVEATNAQIDQMQNVTFESSDPSVLTVDENGVITAVSQGVATVTATLTYGETTGTDSETIYVVPAYQDHSNLEGFDSSFGSDFNPTGNPIGGGEGYSNLINEATFTVDTVDGLIDALANAQYGDVVYVADHADLLVTNDQAPLEVKAGVTLASGRGSILEDGTVSSGARLKINQAGVHLIKVLGPNARITGLRLDGQDYERGTSAYNPTITWGINARGSWVEVDNNELLGWSYGAVIANDAYIHHNYIHHNIRLGLGYGVVIWGRDSKVSDGVLVEANILDWNRHSIAGKGIPTERYEARYNTILDYHTSHVFDMHGTNDGSGGHGGDWIKIHHNKFTDVVSPLHGGSQTGYVNRGKSVTGSLIHNNEFYHADPLLGVNHKFAFGNMFVGKNKYGMGTEISYHEGVYRNRVTEYLFKNLTPSDTNLSESDIVNESGLNVDVNATSVGDYVTYEINVPIEGRYNFDILTGAANSSLGIADVLVDGQVVGTIDFSSGDTSGYVHHITDTVSLTEGTHTVSFEVTGANDGYNLDLVQIRLLKKNGIILSTESHELAIGQTTQVAFNQNVASTTFTSDNENVATVDENGVVTAHGIGQALITGVANDLGLESSVLITVNRESADEVILESVQLVPENDYMFVGNTQNYQVVGTMSDGSEADLSGAQVEFYTDNPFVLTVSENGSVTALIQGTASVRADVTLDGVTRSNKHIATVTKAFSSITLTAGSTHLLEGQTTDFSVSGTMEDGSAANFTTADIVYSTSDSNIATIDQTGTMTAIGPGTATITVEVTLFGQTLTDSMDVLVESSNSSMLINDDFENSEIGSMPLGWTDDFGNGTIEVVSNNDNTNSYLQISRPDSGSNAVVDRSFQSTDGKLVLEYDAYSGQTNSWVAAFYIRNADGKNVIRTYFDNDTGQLMVRDGSNTDMPLTDYQANTWYSIKLVIDQENRTYDAYLGGELIYSGLAFNTSNTSPINLLRAFVGGISGDATGDTLTAGFDNVKLYKSTIFEDDFENATTGSIPLGWEDNFGNGTIEVVSNNDSTNSFLKISRPDDGSNAVVDRSFQEKEGKLILEYDAFSGQTNSWVAAFYIRNADGKNVIRTYFDNDTGQLMVRDGSNTDMPLTDYQSNTWYSIKLVIDQENKTYDAYLGGELIYSGLAFNTSNTSPINLLRAFVGGTSTDPVGDTLTAGLDNVKLSVE